MKKYILSLDQGTTSSRAVLYDENAQLLNISQKETLQYFPQQGWVEQMPDEIWENQYKMALDVIEKSNINAGDIAAIGISNQRETTLVWSKITGKPIYPAIIWQDNRTKNFCEELIQKGYRDLIHNKTGLIIDSYFSASKLHWILHNVPDAKSKAMQGELLFGTIDTFLVWKLSGGALHITDASNASRTMLYNIAEGCWDNELLRIFEIPNNILPVVVDTSAVYGVTDKELFQGVEIPISAVVGDQQSALFGQLALYSGMAKNTYGTGCFLLMNTGSRLLISSHGLLSTIAWRINNEVCYAMEGSVLVGGAVMKWLRDNLQIIDDVAESESIANKAGNNAGVYFVPAFAGLGSPYWNMDAKAMITGMTLGTGRQHIIRAAIESMAFQSYDLMKLIEEESGITLTSLLVDGGATRNDFLLQFQADLLNINVEKPVNSETTSLGAAYLAGLGVGLWKLNDLKGFYKDVKIFSSQMTSEVRAAYLTEWHHAIKQCLQ